MNGLVILETRRGSIQKFFPSGGYYDNEVVNPIIDITPGRSA